MIAIHAEGWFMSIECRYLDVPRRSREIELENRKRWCEARVKGKAERRMEAVTTVTSRKGKGRENWGKQRETDGTRNSCEAQMRCRVQVAERKIIRVPCIYPRLSCQNDRIFCTYQVCGESIGDEFY